MKLRRNLRCLIFTPIVGAVATVSTQPFSTTNYAIERLGSVDLGILAETTPVVWQGELWLLECLQGGRYYANINYTSYPDEPQPPGYLRFVNVKSGEHSQPFAEGYGLGSALVVDDRLYVFATATPFGISSNNTVVSVFWSDNMQAWATNKALDASQPNFFPPGVTSKAFYNTCVRPVVEASSIGNEASFVMAYEFNEPGAGWQTGIATTSDTDLTKAAWTPVTRPNTTAAVDFSKLAHANPTLRYGEVNGDGGWWYLLTTRGTNGTNVEEIYRSRDVLKFDWEAPSGWSEDDALAAAFMVPSFADQVPLRGPWHPDTKPLVVGNASALANATNDNASDLDLCTLPMETGVDATVMYYAWGNQELGPTAMVLAMAIVENCTEEQLLASYFV